ncbi:hypothetical protein ABTM19_19685, partial [Acinetobacter baumannii]
GTNEGRLSIRRNNRYGKHRKYQQLFHVAKLGKCRHLQNLLRCINIFLIREKSCYRNDVNGFPMFG